MREFKFRAWDGTNMYTPIIGSDGKLYREDRDYEDGNDAPHDELMQFTGMKDRNGKDIYEGDIVSYTSSEKVGERRVMQRRGYDTYAVYGEVEVRGVVKFGTINRPFEYGLLYYVDTDKSVSYNTYFWGSGKKGDRPEMKSSNLTKSLRNNVDYEVIGNVYENPELLEESQ